MVSFKFGLRDEGLRIMIGGRAYDNLDQYSTGWKSTGPSIYGAFNSFIPDTFEYNRSGEPLVANFDPPLVLGTGKATKRIRIPIPQLREEVSELEKALTDAPRDQKYKKIFRNTEKKHFIHGDEHTERIRCLWKQRTSFLRYSVDLPRERTQKYNVLLAQISKASTARTFII